MPSTKDLKMKTFIVLFIFFISKVYSNNSVDVCDWRGSGLNSADNGIVPVYLRCTTGEIEWSYPRGGLRVVLRPYFPRERLFRGCIRVELNVSASVKAYVEGYRNLYPLYSVDDGQHPDLLRCFYSKDGRVALYLESTARSSVRRENFNFRYKLIPYNSPQGITNELEECRPCTDDEILSAYITSDIVVKGSISSMKSNKQLERNELNVTLNEIIKFINEKNGPNHDLLSTTNYLILHHPLKCQASASKESKFLFLAQWILGNPVIKCAPKLDHWKRIKSQTCKIEEEKNIAFNKIK